MLFDGRELTAICNNCYKSHCDELKRWLITRFSDIMQDKNEQNAFTLPIPRNVFYINTVMYIGDYCFLLYKTVLRYRNGIRVQFYFKPWELSSIVAT